MEIKIKKIIKRNGQIVEFDPMKITNAIWKAVKACHGNDYKRVIELTELVCDYLARHVEGDTVDIEQVQDAVEKILIEEGHAKVAKAYILYRKQRADARRVGQLFMNNALVTNYLDRNDWMVKENSNMTYSYQGMNVYISGKIISDYWMDRIYPEAISHAQNEGDIRIHDRGSLSVYCVGWDLRDLLMVGFRGVPGKIASKPPKHFRSALGQIVNFIYTLQGEAAGAQAFSNFDTLLAPFIRYDNMDYKQVKQALQEFVFNMNVPTRVGFQTPFSNITLDLKVPEYMKNEPVIIGGKYTDDVYGDFQKEMDMFNQAFAEVMMEGDAEERVFTFPIPTYNITEDFDWDNPAYEKIWEMTAKYGIPYFSNFIGSDMRPEDARSMCCRLRLDNRELQKRMGGLFASAPLTGSIGVVTINMSRIGYLAKDEDDFFARLGLLMDLAKDSLEIKRKVIENLTEQGLYPYSKYYLRSVKMQTGQYWSNHFSTIGLIGMHEACLNFLGKGIETPEGKAFTEKVMDFMLERIECYQLKTGNLYNLEATPGEGTSFDLAQIDKAKYPQIICSGSDAVSYYTNSTQLPVDCSDDLFFVLQHQESLQTRYTGGTVAHIFLGERASAEGAKALVKKVCHKFKIPYFTLTPTFSICPSHGYLSGEHRNCPVCEAEGKQTACEIYSRVVGYLRPVDQWNAGKQEEFYSRKLFDSAL